MEQWQPWTHAVLWLLDCGTRRPRLWLRSSYEWCPYLSTALPVSLRAHPTTLLSPCSTLSRLCNSSRVLLSAQHMHVVHLFTFALNRCASLNKSPPLLPLLSTYSTTSHFSLNILHLSSLRSQQMHLFSSLQIRLHSSTRSRILSGNDKWTYIWLSSGRYGVRQKLRPTGCCIWLRKQRDWKCPCRVRRCQTHMPSKLRLQQTSRIKLCRCAFDRNFQWQRHYLRCIRGVCTERLQDFGGTTLRHMAQYNDFVSVCTAVCSTEYQLRASERV